MKPFFSFALALALLAGSLDASKQPPAPDPRGDANLTGQILGPDGAPASGATVVYRPGLFLVRTDSEGRYEIQGVRPGRGMVTARHEDLGVRSSDVDLRSGENHLDLTLRPMPPRRAIRGRVVDPDGQPVEGVRVENHPDGFSTLTDADGSFFLETRQTGFDLVAKKAGFASGLLHDFTGTVSSEGLEIRLGLKIPLSGRLRLAGPLWHPLRLSLPGIDRAPTVSYTGRVVDGATGRPIAGARVWPGDDPGAFVTTDARGVYRLAWQPAAPVRLWVETEGYVPFHKPFQPPTPWIVSPKAPTLAAWPARTLAGTVTRPDGRPVPGAGVRVFSRYSHQIQEVAKTLTSEQGRFQLAVMQDGHYEVIAVSPGLAPASESMTLVEGQAGISGIRLVLRSGRTVSGRVVDELGRPVAEARVALTRNGSHRLLLIDSAADNGLYQTTTDGDGRFEIPGLPAGWFDLEASRPGFLPERFQALELDGGSGSADLGTVTLRQPATVTGWVIGQSREPLAGVMVRLKSGGVPGIEVVSGPDGRFELTAPDPRTPFEIEACRPDRWTTTYPYETLPDGPVEITLPPAARLTGRVVDPDGQPAAGASVTASVRPAPSFWPSELSPCPPMAEVETKTDAEGRFVLAPVPVVELYVSASRPDYVESGVETVNFDEGRLEAEVPLLALKRAAAVSGRVLQADGSPVPGAWMTLQGRSGYYFLMMMALTDGDGRYRIAGLPAGPPTTIYARHDTLGAGERDFEIAPGESQVDITVEPAEPRLARGRVVDPDGQPVAGALVEQGLQTVYTDAGGGFATPVGEDGYELVARKAGYASAYLSHRAAGGAREGLELRLGREVSVSGRLFGFDPENPAEIARTWVSATFLQSSKIRVEGRVSSDGTYHVQGLWPGEWHISANLGERFAESTITITADGTEVEQDLSLPNQAEVQTIEPNE